MAAFQLRAPHNVRLLAGDHGPIRGEQHIYLVEHPARRGTPVDFRLVNKPECDAERRQDLVAHRKEGQVVAAYPTLVLGDYSVN
ncbi:MAG: hypothetical protein HRF49_07415 [bacterium]